jgi:hypothetical protein
MDVYSGGFCHPPQYGIYRIPSKRVKRTVIRRREIPMRADVFIDKTEGEG